ncbi:hypothetical protein DSL72_005583 [Monilinia vaccinii-corymbosi]|uniref:Myb/SANT-like domain-containing protein n=1 Tax=Monilinia vaccinii-corymbosi TaxID=61207 RepID=A0A8A3PG25_9HELO|nr:hypothetical protein DSL72_005583 [Monilinia vaccinii-corymbosi]
MSENESDTASLPSLSSVFARDTHLDSNQLPTRPCLHGTEYPPPIPPHIRMPPLPPRSTPSIRSFGSTPQPNTTSKRSTLGTPHGFASNATPPSTNNGMNQVDLPLRGGVERRSPEPPSSSVQWISSPSPSQSSSRISLLRDPHHCLLFIQSALARKADHVHGRKNIMWQAVCNDLARDTGLRINAVSAGNAMRNMVKKRKDGLIAKKGRSEETQAISDVQIALDQWIAFIDLQDQLNATPERNFTLEGNATALAAARAESNSERETRDQYLHHAERETREPSIRWIPSASSTPGLSDPPVHKRQRRVQQRRSSWTLHIDSNVSSYSPPEYAQAFAAMEGNHSNLLGRLDSLQNQVSLMVGMLEEVLRNQNKRRRSPSTCC